MYEVNIDDFKLLDLVKSNKLLYDRKHPAYHDKPRRDVTWKAIGAALGTTGENCHKRFRNLRDRFTKARRVRKEEMLEDPSLPLVYRNMMFLWDHLSHRTSTSMRPEVVKLKAATSSEIEANEETENQIQTLEGPVEYEEVQLVANESGICSQGQVIFICDTSQDVEVTCEEQGTFVTGYVETEIIPQSDSFGTIENSAVESTCEQQNETDIDSAGTETYPQNHVPSGQEIGTPSKSESKNPATERVFEQQNQTIQTYRNSEEHSYDQIFKRKRNRPKFVFNKRRRPLLLPKPIKTSKASNQAFSTKASNQTFSAKTSSQTFSAKTSNQTFSAKANNQTFSAKASNQTFPAKTSSQAFCSKASNQAFCTLLKYYLDKINKPDRLSATRLQILKTLHSEIYPDY